MSSTLLNEPQLFVHQKAIEELRGIEAKRLSIAPFLNEAHLSGIRVRTAGSQEAIRITGSLSVSF